MEFLNHQNAVTLHVLEVLVHTLLPRMKSTSFACVTKREHLRN